MNKDALIKSEQIRGNQDSFMNKSLIKLIMRKSRIGKKYLKWPSRESLIIYDKAKNKCNSFILKPKKEYFQNVSNANSSQSKSFWNVIKPFVPNKGAISNENIVIKP